ncbi:MAG: site-specific DNA-methyltransferase [Methylophilus sp.]|nr:site-specific DNA-methyltransferase [Methylophilus sp.]
MPTLNWIGKEAVVKHHKEVPYRLLESIAELSVGEPHSGNLIVQGDNLHALKALLPRYAGQVKCIYIDPPYNTGEEGGDGKGWTYNDNVNSPEIKKWLGNTVGSEGEDLSRHDKWLCMMYPRLLLLKQFLSKDGLIFVSMDESEIGNLRLMMEEIFSKSNFLGTFIWKSRRNKDSRHKSNISTDHEYVLCFHGGVGKLKGSLIDMNKYSCPDNDPRGPWMSDNLVGLATKDRRPNLHYDLVNPDTGINYGCPEKGWRYSKETIAKKIIENRIIWPQKSTGRPRHKKFLNELSSEFTGFSSFVECGNTNEGTETVRDILGENIFMFPKPPSLIKELIFQSTENNSIILDSFAGSGTTGHSTLMLNNEDGGNRKFILVEMDNNIARNVTAVRLNRVINGYKKQNGDMAKALGGDFQFCKLSDEPLFTAEGEIRPDVTFAQLAEFVWFMETGSGYSGSFGSSPLLGTFEGRAVYLLYNGILKDKSVGGGNVLTAAVLGVLPEHQGPKVIYAAANRLGSPRLTKEQIIFKQTPYALGES